ncbi:MAG: hypothetical protein OEW15_18755 [Nitrospirota bacterium]|nr:hypothetical protein [Nitrospirota bacterium]
MILFGIAAITLVAVLLYGSYTEGKRHDEMLLEAIDGWTKEMKFASVIYDIHDAARGILEDLDIMHPPELSAKDGKLLQFLGTEWGRKTYGEDIWVLCTQAEVRKFFTSHDQDETYAPESSDDDVTVIISDCRFKNEFNAFPDALKIRLECPRELRRERCEQWRENDTHPSEVDLDTYAAENQFDLLFDTHLSEPEEIVAKVVAHIKQENRK